MLRGRELEHEVVRKARGVPLDRLIESLDLDLVERGQITIEEDGMTADLLDLSLDGTGQHAHRHLRFPFARPVYRCARRTGSVSQPLYAGANVSFANCSSVVGVVAWAFR